MRHSRIFLGGLALCVGAFALPVTTANAGEILITPAEAQLPVAKGAFGVATRGITRGPKIAVVSTPDGLKSPIRLQMNFESFGGAKIDTSTLKVTYLKDPAVDLTSRVKPFAKEGGIDMPDAILPPGNHTLRVDVKDSDGRVATSSIVLKIVP